MDARAEETLRLAMAEICRRLRQRGRQAPPTTLLPFYEELCRQLQEGAVVTQRLRAALGPGPWPPARSLRRFAEACLLEVVSLALHLAGGSVATGRMACAAGIESYNTYVRIHRASTGENPALLHVPARPVFDALRWHQIVHGALRPEDTGGLARRLLDLRPEAFSDGLPEARRLGEDLASHTAPAPWRLAAVPQAELGDVLEQAREPLCRRMDQEAEGVPSPYGDALRFLVSGLSLRGLDRETVCREIRSNDTSLSTKILFFAGDTLKDLIDQLRLDMALRLLPDRRFSAEAIAEAVGVHVRTLRRMFLERTGARLSDVHTTVKKTFGHPAFESWQRAEDGDLEDDEARRLGGYLLAVHPGAFSPTVPPRLQDAPRLVLLPDVTSVPGLLAEAAPEEPVAEAGEPLPEAFSRPETEVREDLGRLREMAGILSAVGRENPEDARAVERMCASHRLAAYLYRVREIQCFVTADRLLEAGQIPSVEPWAECLRVMSQEDPVPLEEWREVVERFTDAKQAVELWIAADTERRRLLEKTGKDRIRALRKHASYLLARTCLFAAERYHRGQGLHGLMLEENQAAVAMARWLRKRHFSRRSRSRPRRPSVLTDLEVLALARIANDRRIGGNVDLAVAAIGEAHKAARKAPIGAYVEAEVASLEASVLKDQGLDLARAEERADEAIRIFGTFDVHMAARVLVTKAEVQRLDSRECCIATIRKSIDQLDELRETEAKETAQNNLLHYLVEQDRRDEVLYWRGILPFPTTPLYQASRNTIEGCIELAWGDLDRAITLLLSALKSFTRLGRLGDVEISLLYLAAVYAKKHNLEETRARLKAAESISRSGGFAEAIGIQVLLQQMDKSKNLIDRILAIAVEAGGCLGPMDRGTLGQTSR